MFAVALIVLRETLEAALIVSIVLAASVGMRGRIRWIGAGVACGIAGALIVAVFAAGIADAFQGNGQELLNAGILALAVCMLAWHNIWMASHARDLVRTANSVARDVASGGRPMIALALITGAAVLREGSETVLFLFGVVASSSEGAGALLVGGVLGLLGGTALGTAVYFGLLRIPVKRLFGVMSVLVLFLAAGLAAQSVSFLVQADLLPSLGDGLWDTSFLLTEDSITGKIFHTLIGYVARPSGIQLLAWIVTVMAIALPTWMIGHRRHIAALAVISLGLVAMSHPARAELKVLDPFVEWRELEFEHNGLITFGPKGSSSDRAQSYTNEVEYGVTPWWRIGLEGEMSSGGGQHLIWNATTIENFFQLTDRGKYWLDVGLFAEYSQETGPTEPSSVTFGPLLYKEIPNVFGVDTAHKLNILFSRDVGPNSSKATGLQVSWQSVALLHPLFSPGFEYYALVDDIGHSGSFNQQQHFIGPVLTGEQSFSPYGKLKYEVGYLFGLSTATPRGAVRWKLEYEISF
jgi:high-affinity iron transporter